MLLLTASLHIRSISLIIIDFKYDREKGWHSKGHGAPQHSEV